MYWTSAYKVDESDQMFSEETSVSTCMETIGKSEELHERAEQWTLTHVLIITT